MLMTVFRFMMKYVTTPLIPNLAPNQALVADNASYHSVVLDLVLQYVVMEESRALASNHEDRIQSWRESRGEEPILYCDV